MEGFLHTKDRKVFLASASFKLVFRFVALVFCISGPHDHSFQILWDLMLRGVFLPRRGHCERMEQGSK